MSPPSLPVILDEPSPATARGAIMAGEATTSFSAARLKASALTAPSPLSPLTDLTTPAPDVGYQRLPLINIFRRWLPGSVSTAVIWPPSFLTSDASPPPILDSSKRDSSSFRGNDPK